MQFTLTIELGNDAMQTRADIESALRKLGQDCRYMSDPPEDGDEGRIMDDNGNSVGKWEVTETPSGDPIQRMYDEALENEPQDASDDTPEPRVLYVRAGERGAEIDSWCVIDGDKAYPFGPDEYGRELAVREAAKWQPERFTHLGGATR